MLASLLHRARNGAHQRVRLYPRTAGSPSLRRLVELGTSDAINSIRSMLKLLFVELPSFNCDNDARAHGSRLVWAGQEHPSAIVKRHSRRAFEAD